MFARTRNHRGAGGIGCLLLIGIAAAGIYSGIAVGLPQLRHRSFEDRMNETVGYFASQPEEKIRERIIQVASEFDIALTPDMVKVTIDGSRLTIDLSYQKLIDLYVWQKTQTFTLHRSGRY